ncbi:MAG: nucleotide pyrophosphohydrolase, partial [Thermoguttaceae bacterium]
MKEKTMPEESRYTDATATVDDLKRLVDRFQEERNWAKYHTPKNLASSVAIEAAELMEHFQWLTPEESYEVKNDP